MRFRPDDSTPSGNVFQVIDGSLRPIGLSKFRGHDNSWLQTVAHVAPLLKSVCICNVLGITSDWCASCQRGRVLRIATSDVETGIKELQLSGSISGVWVQELQECCETWMAAGKAVTLDLKDVQYADYAGLDLISKLKSRNVTVVRSTPLVARLLEVHEAQRAE
jgi:anti-anti-sigma regulatory factor